MGRRSKRRKKAAARAYHESQHPRGQPTNSGQFKEKPKVERSKIDPESERILRRAAVALGVREPDPPKPPKANRPARVAASQQKPASAWDSSKTTIPSIRSIIEAAEHGEPTAVRRAVGDTSIPGPEVIKHLASTGQAMGRHWRPVMEALAHRTQPDSRVALMDQAETSRVPLPETAMLVTIWNDKDLATKWVTSHPQLKTFAVAAIVSASSGSRDLLHALPAWSAGMLAAGHEPSDVGFCLVNQVLTDHEEFCEIHTNETRMKFRVMADRSGSDKVLGGAREAATEFDEYHGTNYRDRLFRSAEVVVHGI
jgi:hypothetical protein